MTFGYHRVEILGALISIIFIWIAVGYLIIDAYTRYYNPKQIKEITFVSISALGLIVNIFCLYFLQHHNHKEGKAHLNIRAAFVHVIGDIIQSVGVLIASVLTMFYPEMIIFDILCTILFSFIVVLSTFFVTGDALRILCEGKPKDLCYDEIMKSLQKHDRVISIEDLKLWSISVNIRACAVRIICELNNIEEYEIVLKSIRSILISRFNIQFVSVQIDTEASFIAPTFI